MTTIKGGSSGEIANVDKKLRLGIAGQADSAEVVASIEGRAFFVHSGTVNLTSANKSAIIYMKNTTDRDLILVKTTIHLGTSTGGTGDVVYGVTVNPTGTITSETTLFPFNVNLALQASKPFDSDAFAGVEGSTAVSVLGEITGILPQPGHYNIESNITLPKGASISTLLTPPAGNTSQNVVIDYLCYYADAKTGN